MSGELRSGDIVVTCDLIHEFETNERPHIFKGMKIMRILSLSWPSVRLAPRPYL